MMKMLHLRASIELSVVWWVLTVCVMTACYLGWTRRRYIYMHICTYACIKLCVYICVYIIVCTYICMCVCVHVCVFVY